MKKVRKRLKKNQEAEEPQVPTKKRRCPHLRPKQNQSPRKSLLVRKRAETVRNFLLILTIKEYFSQLEFKDLPLSDQTKKAIDGLGFKKCTEI